MTDTLNIKRRGYLKLTFNTYRKLEKYMKKMPQKDNKTIYYGALPVEIWNGNEDFWIAPNGERITTCF